MNFEALVCTSKPKVKPGFQIVVPVARIVSVASNFWKRQGRSYGNALAITRAIPGRSLRQKRSVVRDRREFYSCDRDDRKRLSIDRIFLMETGFIRQKRQKRWDISHDAPDCLLHVHTRSSKWRQAA